MEQATAKRITSLRAAAVLGAAWALAGCAASTGGSGAAANPAAQDANQTGTSAGNGVITSDVVVASKADAAAAAGPDVENTKVTYNADIGTSCAITGACPANMKCIGGASADSPNVYCSATCTANSDCPPSFECGKQGDGKMCKRRQFCSSCASDAECGAGGRCIAMGGGKFCSQTCNIGKTECPRFAHCEEVAEGGSACVHVAGTCEGDGSLCQPCAASDNCQAGGMCLTFNHTKEQFCAAPCGSGGKCDATYSCVDIATGPSTKQKECVPGDQNAPKCVNKLYPLMEVGDTMGDFAITGFTDSDQNGSLLTTADGNEQPQVIKLSDYASLNGCKVVLFNVAAGWCGPCKQETTTFKSLMAKYPDLCIYQVLFDGVTPGTLPNIQLAKDWIKSFKGQGAVGVDPDRNVAPYNTAGSTPLNLVLDGATLKVLKKMNGVPPTGIGGELAPFFK